MFTNTKDLKGLVIRATDGELGTVDQVYFDDETWAIRYFTVETGGWLGGRQVLISPMSIVGADWQSKRLDVALTMRQVEQGPDIDTHMPVSRQQEAAYLSYYGYPYYWEGPYTWGPAFSPAGLSTPTARLCSIWVARSFWISMVSCSGSSGSRSTAMTPFRRRKSMCSW